MSNIMILFLILHKKKKKKEKRRKKKIARALPLSQCWRDLVTSMNWKVWTGVLMCETYLFLTGPSSKIWQPKQNEFNFHFTWLDSYSTVISVANNFITKKNKGSSWTPRCSSELLSE